MVLTFEFDKLLISMFDPPFCTIVILYLQSASFLKFVTVDLFEGAIIRNSLSHISLKLFEVENFTFN